MRNVLLVLGVNAVAAAVPFTPQGAGVAQALLVKVFAGTAAASTVAAYSVGQQIAIGVLTFGDRLRRARVHLPRAQLQGGDPAGPGDRGRREAPRSCGSAGPVRLRTDA